MSQIPLVYDMANVKTAKTSSTTKVGRSAASTATSRRVDPHKFSKLLITHCRENKFSIPDVDFLDFLDNWANGKFEEDIPLLLSESSTQENPSSDEEIDEDSSPRRERQFHY